MYSTWTARASHMKEICYYNLLHGSKETQKVNLSPGTGLLSLISLSMYELDTPATKQKKEKEVVFCIN